MKFKTPAVAAAAFILGAVAIPSVVSAQGEDSPTSSGTHDQQSQTTTRADSSNPIMGFAVGVGDAAVDGLVPGELNGELSGARIETTQDVFESVVGDPERLDSNRFEVTAVSLEDFDPEGFDPEDFDPEGFDLEGVELEEFKPTPEQIAEWNASSEKLIVELAAAGIPVERAEDDGFVYFEITAELTTAQKADLDRILSEHFGDGVAMVAVAASSADPST